jgi:hypothetical protein
MGFETVVLNKVETILSESRKAGFYNGTLFVECSAEKAQEVFEELSLKYGKIILSGPVANEYSYDFVA